MEIKLFYCGLCKEQKRKPMIRENLRKHLREDHGIRSNITNFSISKDGYVKQKWWITKEV